MPCVTGRDIAPGTISIRDRLEREAAFDVTDEPAVLAAFAQLDEAGIEVDILVNMITEMNTALIENPTFDAWVKGRTPARRWGRPDELIGAAVFLASAASSYVNGHIIYVDGGMLAVL